MTILRNLAGILLALFLAAPAQAEIDPQRLQQSR